VPVGRDYNAMTHCKEPFSPIFRRFLHIKGSLSCEKYAFLTFRLSPKAKEPRFTGLFEPPAESELAHHRAAIDDHALARHEAAIVAGQKDQCTKQIFGLLLALKRAAHHGRL